MHSADSRGYSASTDSKASDWRTRCLRVALGIASVIVIVGGVAFLAVSR